MNLKPRIPDMLLVLAWFVLDQASKAWAASGALSRPWPLIPASLRLTLSHNTGALFGFMSDFPDPWRSIALIALPIGAVIIITVLLLRVPLQELRIRLALALILGGAFGNLTDRMLHGYVIDFIDVYAGFPPAKDWLISTFGTNRWPTFNVADMGLSCGALLLLSEVFLDMLPSRRAKSAIKECQGASDTD